MGLEHIEEYLGAIFRLRETSTTPLPLGRLQEHFGFSPISIHEMVQKLEGMELISYLPYRGVLLSPKGEAMAAALVRRHRIWECFLTDLLSLPWDTAHEVADQLEHAAPELVTERLADLLGRPEFCPHGTKIPPRDPDTAVGFLQTPTSRLTQCFPGKSYRVCFISPEIPDYLKQFQGWGIQPGCTVQFIEKKDASSEVKIKEREISLQDPLAQTIWVIEAAV